MDDVTKNCKSGHISIITIVVRGDQWTTLDGDVTLCHSSKLAVTLYTTPISSQLSDASLARTRRYG